MPSTPLELERRSLALVVKASDHCLSISAIPLFPHIHAQASSGTQSTPPKNRSNSNPLEARKVGYKEARNIMEVELRGHWVGPMPYNEFMEKFMSTDDPAPVGVVDENYFATIPTGPEDKMYLPFVNCIKDANLAPSMAFFNSSSFDDHDSLLHKKWKPDIAGYRKADTEKISDDKPTNFEKLDLYIEVKTNVFPFSDPKPNCSPEERQKHQFENRGDLAEDCRGQIGLVMAEICARQYRTHSFMVFLNHKEVRFLYNDRSAIVVTEAIDYRTESKKLAEFFWRYSRMSDAQRGMDTSVRPSTPEEIGKAETALAPYLPRGETPRPYITLSVPTADGAERLVVGRDCMMEPDSVTGRATRAFPVYDLKTGKIEFLKDTWRVDLPGMDKESDILKELNEKQVRNVPVFVDGGDVLGSRQTTVSHEFENASWRAGRLAVLVPRAHNRFLENFIGKRLSKFTNARQFLTIVMHAIEAHHDALYLCGFLHRDISDNNIMITDADCGILSDWDMAKRVGIPGQKPPDPLPGARHAYRTGTWYFMSGLLLVNPYKLHTLQDDLESFFHVILYYSLQYFPHDKQSGEVQDIIVKIFKQCEYETFTGLYTGGTGKQNMILFENAFDGLTLTNNGPLSEWIRSALNALGDFYSYLSSLQRQHRAASSPARKPPTFFPPDTDKLANHNYFLQLCTTALAAPDAQWSDDRRPTMLVPHLPIKTTKQLPTLKRPAEIEPAGDDLPAPKKGRASGSGRPPKKNSQLSSSKRR
ncbi:unnamed protein product [Cyclocybe aegerita]|uniref:Protein kinase domain-containing protein n=1 Tax=Cyclocybe aegerita TaxID=1973307 RepID=A0A8S0VZR2_CYCAE|nr:unnamed protein product [Cyclocybe aegerita]